MNSIFTSSVLSLVSSHFTTLALFATLHSLNTPCPFFSLALCHCFPFLYSVIVYLCYVCKGNHINTKGVFGGNFFLMSKLAFLQCFGFLVPSCYLLTKVNFSMYIIKSYPLDFIFTTSISSILLRERITIKALIRTFFMTGVYFLTCYFKVTEEDDGISYRFYFLEEEEPVSTDP